jgi:hypothetical protein
MSTPKSDPGCTQSECLRLLQDSIRDLSAQRTPLGRSSERRAASATAVALRTAGVLSEADFITWLDRIAQADKSSRAKVQDADIHVRECISIIQGALNLGTKEQVEGVRNHASGFSRALFLAGQIDRRTWLELTELTTTTINAWYRASNLPIPSSLGDMLNEAGSAE